MHSSIRISSPWANAASMAAGSSSGVWTFVTPKRRTAGVGFYEKRHAQFRDDFRRVERLAPAQENFACEVDTARQRAFGGDFVEGDDRRGHRARRIGNAHHVEVSLQFAVLAGRAVDDDEGIVERFSFTVYGDRKVVLVHLPLAAVGRRVVPSRGRGDRRP